MVKLVITSKQTMNFERFGEMIMKDMIQKETFIEMINSHLRHLKDVLDRLLIMKHNNELNDVIRGSEKIIQNIIIVLTRIWVMKNILKILENKLIDATNFGTNDKKIELGVQEYIMQYTAILDNYYLLHDLLTDPEKIKEYSMGDKKIQEKGIALMIKYTFKVLNYEAHMRNEQTFDYSHDFADIISHFDSKLNNGYYHGL